MTKFLAANLAVEGSFAGVTAAVVFQVDFRLERSIADVALEIADILMVRFDMSLQPTRFGKTFVAVFAFYLSTDAVCSEVVSQRVPVGVLLLADVTFEFVEFVLVAAFVQPRGGPIVESGGTPITKIFAVFIDTALVEGRTVVDGGDSNKVFGAFGVFAESSVLEIWRDRVSGDMKFQMAPQVLAVGEFFQTR